MVGQLKNLLRRQVALKPVDSASDHPNISSDVSFCGIDTVQRRRVVISPATGLCDERIIGDWASIRNFKIRGGNGELHTQSLCSRARSMHQGSFLGSSHRCSKAIIFSKLISFFDAAQAVVLSLLVLSRGRSGASLDKLLLFVFKIVFSKIRRVVCHRPSISTRLEYSTYFPHFQMTFGHSLSYYQSGGRP